MPENERALRQQRVISAAEKFVTDQNTLHPLNPVWDNRFMTLLEQGRLTELDGVGNEELSAMAGKSTHEVALGCCLRRHFCLWQLAQRRPLLSPDPGVDRRIRLVERRHTELKQN